MTRKVAAFDFDGTLLNGDAVLPFCMLAGGRTRVALTLARNASLFPAIRRDRNRRDDLKAALAHGCFHGLTVGHVGACATAYAKSVVESRLFPSVVERLDWHRSQGHETLIVSASFEVYLRRIAEYLNVDAVLGTRLVQSAGVYTGALDGANVRAEQKAVRLREHLGNDEFELWAYGNSADDDAMLAMSHHPFRVDKAGVLSAGGGPQ